MFPTVTREALLVAFTGAAGAGGDGGGAAPIEDLSAACAFLVRRALRVGHPSRESESSTAAALAFLSEQTL